MKSCSSIEKIAHLISSCKQYGIEEFVITSGGRNAPIADYFLHFLPEARYWNYFEERSAGFFALGRTLIHQKPCAVITTSGTAVAELLPSVVEAFHQGKPLVIISADHLSSSNLGISQSIQQVGIFSHFVEGSIDLKDSKTLPFEAWNSLLPWHINLRLEEDWNQKDFQTIAQYPRIEKKTTSLVLEERKKLEAFLQLKRDENFIVFLGGLGGDSDKEAVLAFLKMLNAPVIADPTSGLREKLKNLLLINGDFCLDQISPHKVLRIGDVPISSSWQKLDKIDVSVCSLSSRGWYGLKKKGILLTSDIASLLSSLSFDFISHFNPWEELEKERRKKIKNLLKKYPLSEQSLFFQVSKLASNASSLYLGNSLPIREWAAYSDIHFSFTDVFANRGVNGIDGQIATWLGVSADKNDSWAILGDLTTLYDLSSLGLLAQTKNENRVLVVVNNKGGQIFSRLERMQRNQMVDLMLNKHQLCFQALADFWKMNYSIMDCSSFSFENKEKKKATLLEVCPDLEQSRLFEEELS